MRKPVFPRIVQLLFLYLGIFIALVIIQFAKRGSFTQRAGNFVVTGQYRQPGESDPPKASNEYLLAGDVHVLFGGMDFLLVKGNNGQSLYIIGEDGSREEVLPERVFISEDSVHFIFSGGVELEFVQYPGDTTEMMIFGTFPEGVTGIELPFKPQRRTGIRDTGDGQFIASSNGVNYSFGRSPMDSSTRTLFIMSEGERVSYRAIPEQRAFSPNDFILPQAANAGTYNEAIARWRDENYSLWNRIISAQNNEDIVIAFGDEALARGTYRAAIASVSQAFLSGNTRTYESSVYLGSLNQAQRSLSSLEGEKIAGLTRQINDKSLEFLKEHRVFEYFAVRGLFNLFDAGAELVRSIDPATLALDITPGILEGYIDWKTFRPNTDNPFERLVDQVFLVISESLREFAVSSSTAGDSGQGKRIFTFYGSQGETEFNLRLGKALLAYAEAASGGEQNSASYNSWAGIGRSLILSALSMGEPSGTVKAGLIISDNGEIGENPSPSGLTTAKLYRLLNPAASYPRAISIGAPVSGIWTWTAAQAVSASQENNVLDIAVTFPVGETHYMIIRGIRSFAKIQLYNIDFRTDPQFERYDSSGWSYIAQEQILILKMRHREQVEHIRIFY